MGYKSMTQLENNEYCRRSDVKSAIEYLKSKIEDADPKFADEESIISLIDESFSNAIMGKSSPTPHHDENKESEN